MNDYKVGHITVIKGRKKWETTKAFGIAIVLAPIIWAYIVLAIIALS